MLDVIVIGGGIVGASVGYHLTRLGADAALVDRDDPGRGTEAAAGILSPATTPHIPERAYEFAVDAAAYYPRLLDALGPALPADTHRTCGLVVVDDGADSAAFDRTSEAVRARSEQFGHPPAGAIHERDPGAIRERVPILGAIDAGLWYEDAARVCGGPLTEAVIEAGTAAGLRTITGDAERIESTDGVATGVTIDGETHAAESVVVAGGAWSAAFEEQVGTDLPVTPQRGQVVHLDHRDPDAATWPIVQTAAQDHSLIPWPDGRVIAAATMESGSGFAAHTTATGVRDLLDETLRLAPGLGDATVDETRVGLRPRTPDDRPVIGAIPTLEGAYVATGHGPVGLMLGPYTGRVVASLAIGESVDADLSAFAPDRFG